jgi:hypothetical protein
VLTEVAASWDAQPLDTTGDTLAARVVGGTDLWITHDAGATWQSTGPVVAAPPMAGLVGLVGLLITEATLGGGPKACHCLFALVAPRARDKSAGCVWR